MRNLFIHIGLHKTGTSYIQKLFAANRDTLSESGIGLAPYLSPFTSCHHPIIQAIETEGADRVFDAVAQTPGDSVLISAEELCIVMQDPVKAEAIRAAAARHFNPRIVIFIRRQDELKESVYSQVVKQWFVGGILDDEHYDYHHDARLRALEDVFGIENVTVRIYEVDRKDIAGALLEVMGAVVDRSRLVEVAPQNVSMNRRKLVFLSRVPKPPEDAPLRLRYPLRFLVRTLADSDAIAGDAYRGMMSPAQRRDLVAAHHDGNAALVARHGIAETGSFLELPDASEAWAPPAPISRGERLALFRHVTRAAWSDHNPYTATRLAAIMARPVLAAGAG